MLSAIIAGHAIAANVPGAWPALCIAALVVLRPGES